MNAIDKQRCDDARHLIQAELDRSLRADEATRLYRHLDLCADCRSYRAELAQVQTLLQQVGHAHGHLPHNVPDMAHDVTRRLRREQPRRMLFALAQATAQFGGLALVAVLALNSAGWVARSTPDTPGPAVVNAVGVGADEPAGVGVAEPMRIPDSEFDDETPDLVRAVDPSRSRIQVIQPGSLQPD